MKVGGKKRQDAIYERETHSCFSQMRLSGFLKKKKKEKDTKTEFKESGGAPLNQDGRRVDIKMDKEADS